MTRVFTYHQVQQTTVGRFETGPLHHDVVAGIMWLYQKFDADANAGYYQPYQHGNIFTTRPTGTNAHSYNPKLYNYVDYTQVAPFWSDTITWHRWSLLAGARYMDYIENDYATDGSGRRTAARQNNPVTPVVSLSCKPAPDINAYFSYVEAMQAGTQAAATATNVTGSVGARCSFSPGRFARSRSARGSISDPVPGQSATGEKKSMEP